MTLTRTEARTVGLMKHRSRAALLLMAQGGGRSRAEWAQDPGWPSTLQNFRKAIAHLMPWFVYEVGHDGPNGSAEVALSPRGYEAVELLRLLMAAEERGDLLRAEWVKREGGVCA